MEEGDGEHGPGGGTGGNTAGAATAAAGTAEQTGQTLQDGGSGLQSEPSIGQVRRVREDEPGEEGGQAAGDGTVFLLLQAFQGRGVLCQELPTATRFACISAISGRILVIFSIFKIPVAYSIRFIKLNFLHSDCGMRYSDFTWEK
jgi:hypothetical protein